MKRFQSRAHCIFSVLSKRKGRLEALHPRVSLQGLCCFLSRGRLACVRLQGHASSVGLSSRPGLPLHTER